MTAEPRTGGAWASAFRICFERMSPGQKSDLEEARGGPAEQGDRGSSYAGDGKNLIDAALRRVLEELPDAILLLDEEWRITYANLTACRNGFLRPEQVERHEILWEVYPQLLGTRLEQKYREVVKFGEKRNEAGFYYAPFGKWYDIQMLPMESGVAVYYRDVTAAHEAEAARATVAEQLQQVMDATTDAVFSLDREWRFTFLNQRAREILAASGDPLGSNLWERYPATVYEGSPYVDNYQRAMHEGVAGAFEAYYPEPLNFWLQVMVRPARDGIVVFFRDITERKLTDEAMRKQRARFELVAEAAQVGYWFCDLPFDKLIWDKRVKEHFWLAADAEVTIETFYARVHPDDRERTRKAIAESIEKRVGYDTDYRTVAEDGREKWVRAIGRTFYDAAGKPQSFDGVTLDVTEKKRGEEALRASEERYRVLTELNPQALWTADAEGRVLYANQRFLEYIGKDFVPRDGTEYLNCFYEGDRERVLRVWSRSVATGEDYVIDARLLRSSDGAVRWWHLRALPLRDEEGRIQQWLGVATDVHESRMAAEQLREQYAEIDRLRTLAENSRDFIAISDLEGKAIYGNQAARAIVGIEDEVEFASKHLEDFFFPEDQKFIRNDFLPRVLREGHGEVEVRFRHFKTGAAIWMNYHVFSMPDREGKPAGLATVSRDVTAQRRAEEALMRSEKLAAVGRLASSIAHEINNPLEAVTNLLYLARQRTQDEESAKLLDSADEELRRVSNIASQTLRFHKQATRPQAVGCEDLITTVLSIYEGRLKNSKIRIEKRKRSQRPVMCFEGEIRQVLSNLIGNAIDAMPHGGRLLVRSRESTDWTTENKGLVITVADTGSGIDRETRERIFEPFFTTKGFGGTGLGLWVSAEIVARHGGRLRVRSSQKEGCRGTVFTLWLPFAAATA